MEASYRISVTAQASLRSVQKKAVRLLAFGSPHLADQAIGAPRPPFFAVSGNAGHWGLAIFK
jgi:hypothetical protein